MIQIRTKLLWPEEVKRTERHRITHRQESWEEACTALHQVLHKLEVINAFICVEQQESISTHDPAVCVYFRHNGEDFIFPYDRYIRPEHNLMAIVEVLQAYYIQGKYGMILVRSKN